jgi:hypothetical protein
MEYVLSAIFSMYTLSFSTGVMIPAIRIQKEIPVKAQMYGNITPALKLLQNAQS